MCAADCECVFWASTPRRRSDPGYAEACWGGQATALATTTLINQRVAVIADASQDAHDRYARTYLH